MKPQAVVLYLQNQFGNVLTITRKDDHNSFGLVGGKVDSTDNTPRDALNREVFEETLVDISAWGTIDTFTALDNGCLVQAFILPNEASQLFPQIKTEIFEGSASAFVDFKNHRFILNQEHSIFADYNNLLCNHIKEKGLNLCQ